MSVINATPLLAAAGGEYEISRSVRLRSSATAYLSKAAPATSTNTLFTYSVWIKRGTLGVNNTILSAGSSSTSYSDLWFDASNRLCFQESSSGIYTNIISTSVYRDPSAWYHIVLACDYANATASNRVKLYVNGVQITAFTTATYPSSGNSSWIGWTGSTAGEAIGKWVGGTDYFDGYITEVNFVTSQALTPSSFGETDSITGVWKPKKYAGTYGTNGFYLNFSNAASTTTIGYDYSGNGNNWTSNNISVTSGVTYDSMIDVPTMYADGGNGRGNYAVLNPLAFYGTGASASNGNLRLTVTTSGGNLRPSFGATSGKYYAEFTIADIGGNSGTSFSIQTAAPSVSGSPLFQAIYYVNGQTYNYSSSSYVSYGASFTTGDIIGVAWDVDNTQVTFYKNNTSQGTLSGAAITPPNPIEPVGVLAATSGGTSSTIVDVNFGQRPFAYTPPTGFKALNTQNLPDATIKKGNAYFDVSTWTGNASTPRAVVSNLAFSPDLVWTKDRSVGYQHSLQDTVRGTGASKKLYSSLTEAENGTNAVYGHINSFDANGFTVATGSGGAQHVNESGVTYVGWQWKAGGSAVSNTAGTITSSVSANTSAGFSVATYTGNATNNATFGHGLGVAPNMVIIKNRAASTFWYVFHSSLPATYNLYLNDTAAQQADNVIRSTSSTTVTVSSSSAVNASGQSMVAYLFAEVAGYSKMGSYTGNGSADGPFLFTGFRPRWVLVKRTDTSGFDWILQDTSRSTYNASDSVLNPNSSAAEQNSAGYTLDVLSNGFKIRNSGGQTNASGGTYIFMALAENPFKNSLAR